MEQEGEQGGGQGGHLGRPAAPASSLGTCALPERRASLCLPGASALGPSRDVSRRPAPRMAPGAAPPSPSPCRGRTPEPITRTLHFPDGSLPPHSEPLTGLLCPTNPWSIRRGASSASGDLLHLLSWCHLFLGSCAEIGHLQHSRASCVVPKPNLHREEPVLLGRRGVCSPGHQLHTCKWGGRDISLRFSFSLLQLFLLLPALSAASVGPQRMEKFCRCFRLCPRLCLFPQISF